MSTKRLGCVALTWNGDLSWVSINVAKLRAYGISFGWFGFYFVRRDEPADRDECSQDPGAPSFPETSEPTAGLDVTPAAPQVTSEERE